MLGKFMSLFNIRDPELVLEDAVWPRKLKPERVIFDKNKPFPTLHFQATHACPFLKFAEGALPAPRDEIGLSRSLTPASPPALVKSGKIKTNNWKYDTRGGYCECCKVNYTSYAKHVSCENHDLFARNDSNYRKVDTLLLAIGTGK